MSVADQNFAEVSDTVSLALFQRSPHLRSPHQASQILSEHRGEWLRFASEQSYNIHRIMIISVMNCDICSFLQADVTKRAMSVTHREQQRDHWRYFPVCCPH